MASPPPGQGTAAELDMLATLNERVLRHLAKDDSPSEDEPS
ncbi:hypothetical protein [Mycobacterium sp. 852002-51057_SCH5723018]|nr:hypothetical protein [Mycobacterium sp. 852002-51057_SCH5723018]